MTETRRSPVEHAAAVIRDALTCERPQCTETDHHRFITENMEIAAENTTRMTDR